LSKETIERANEIVNDYANKKLSDALFKVKGYSQGEKAGNEHEVDLAIKDTNDWINYFAGESDELYDEFCMRKFKTGNGEIFIAHGQEDLTVHKRYD
jgi:predicted glycosyltransferase involved in capsule biosynthesis